jgi:hypothetical protein
VHPFLLLYLYGGVDERGIVLCLLQNTGQSKNTAATPNNVAQIGRV